MSAYVADFLPRGATVSDEVTLICGETRVSGWQSVQITRALDSVPASFDIGLTERYPDKPSVWVQPGQPCTVSIGADLVITGYVDRYNVHLDAGNHTVRVQGRSKSADLVDCSAFMGTADHPTFQVLRASTLSIAQALAKPYGVTINSIAGDGVMVPQFNINLGETAWEIIDRVTRVSQFLAYDMPDGSVLLAQAGSEAMGSGLTIRVNVEAADAEYTMDERYSEYEGHFLSTLVLGNDAGINSPGVGELIKDSGVPRFRRRYVVTEQTDNDGSLAGRRAQWECNRRYGRSKQISIVTDSWRDTTGKLWQPNHVVPLDLAPLKLDTGEAFIVGTVAYRRDETGQHAALTVMPTSAFAPEPVVVQPTPPLVQDVENANPTRPSSSPEPMAVGPGTA